MTDLREEPKLDDEAVAKLIRLCAVDIRPGDDPYPATVTIAGIDTYVFSPSKLVERRAAIAGLLRQLPDEFRLAEGWPLVAAAFDSTGRKWTSREAFVDALFCLGVGAGIATVSRNTDGKPVGKLADLDPLE
jgi:hypothetical protein